MGLMKLEIENEVSRTLPSLRRQVGRLQGDHDGLPLSRMSWIPITWSVLLLRTVGNEDATEFEVLRIFQVQFPRRQWASKKPTELDPELATKGAGFSVH